MGFTHTVTKEVMRWLGFIITDTDHCSIVPEYELGYKLIQQRVRAAQALRLWHIRINMPHRIGVLWLKRLTQLCANRADWKRGIDARTGCTQSLANAFDF